jgi:hypothetical protein
LPSRVNRAKRTNYDIVADQIGRWKLTKTHKVTKCLDLLLRTMVIEGVYILRDPRLQVVVLPGHMIWAYFPIHRRRWIVGKLPHVPEREVKVMMVIGEDCVRDQPLTTTMAELAHHFGHVLCYLQRPKWIHDCADADRAAKDCGLKVFLRTPRQMYKSSGRRKISKSTQMGRH